MRLDIHEKRGIAILWTRTDEDANNLPLEITEKLSALKTKYKRFRVIIMRSGSEELFEQTLTLLLNNRMKKALNDVRAENLQQGRTAV